MQTNHIILTKPPTRIIWGLDGWRPRRVRVWLDGDRVTVQAPGLPGIIDGRMESAEVAARQVKRLNWLLVSLVFPVLRGESIEDVEFIKEERS